MITVTATDARLISRGKRYAFIAWLSAMGFGLLSGGARVYGLDGLASILMVAVWIGGFVFVICWLFLAVSMLILMFNHFSGRSSA